MGTEIQWLKTIIPQLHDELIKFNVGTDPACPNRYSVVGFGRTVPDQFARFFTPADGSIMFPIEQYAQAVSTLVEDPTGRFEDGYQAMNFALDNIPLRQSTAECAVARNMILLTDEDRDTGAGLQGLTRASMQTRLASMNFKLNAIVDNTFDVNGVRGIGRSASVGYGEASESDGCYTSTPSVTNGAGYGNTFNSYTDMALQLGGAAWDILQLRDPSKRTSMSCALLDIKVSEIARDLVQCQVCTCAAGGEELCTTATPAATPQCLCGYNNGTVC